MGIFALALIWRLAYLFRVQHTVLGEVLNADSKIYWDWATYLLRHGPVGKNPFFMAPLYPYVLAGIRALVGDSVTAVLLVQCVWGAVAVVFLADALRRLAGITPAIIVGVALAVYEQAVFFDGLVLAESLLFFLEALLFWLVARGVGKVPGAGRAIAIGVVIGLLAEGRATAVLLLGIPLLVAWGHRLPSRAFAVRSVGLTLLGFLLVTGPVVVRNTMLSREFIPFTYNLGFNLYAGNNPDAVGGFTIITGTQALNPVPEDGGVEADGRDYIFAETGQRLTRRQSSAWWTRRAVEFARENPTNVLGLVLRRAAMMWNVREYPQIEDLDEYRAVAGPIGFPPRIGFAMFGLLALVGAMRLRRGPEWTLTVAYLGATTLGVLPFFVTDRYRHHLVPGAAVLAGCALPIVHAILAHRERAGRLRLVTSAAFAAALTFLPLRGFSSPDHSRTTVNAKASAW